MNDETKKELAKLRRQRHDLAKQIASWARVSTFLSESQAKSLLALYQEMDNTEIQIKDLENGK